MTAESAATCLALSTAALTLRTLLATLDWCEDAHVHRCVSDAVLLLDDARCEAGRTYGRTG